MKQMNKSMNPMGWSLMIAVALFLSFSMWGTACGPNTDQETVAESPGTEPPVTADAGPEPPAPDAAPDTAPTPEPAPEPPPVPDAAPEPAPEPPPVPDTAPEPTPEKMAEPMPEKMADVAPDGGGSNDTVPTDSSLFAWLVAGKYKSFKAESQIHASVAVHSANARVFINSIADQAMAAGGANHPTGSALVKELYTANNTLRGWAVMVKTNGSASSGQNWFWYEILSTTSGASPVANSNGASICTGCHTSGKDYVLTKYPLQ